MKYPEPIKEQLLHAEDVVAHSENYFERSDENGKFPSQFEALRDLLANLMHHAEFHKVDFETVYQNAKHHYEAEWGRFYSGKDAILDGNDERKKYFEEHRRYEYRR